MIKASEAKQIAIDNPRYPSTAAALEFLEEEIRTSASNGEFLVTERGVLEYEVKNTLEACGYKIDSNMWQYTISWLGD